MFNKTTLNTGIYTIQFQKRGLPHAHMLLFLYETLKTPSADHIERVIAAEIPDVTQDSAGYNAVKNIMIHEPCGDLNLKCPCIK